MNIKKKSIQWFSLAEGQKHIQISGDKNKIIQIMKGSGNGIWFAKWQ